MVHSSSPEPFVQRGRGGPDSAAVQTDASVSNVAAVNARRARAGGRQGLLSRGRSVPDGIHQAPLLKSTNNARMIY